MPGRTFLAAALNRLSTKLGYGCVKEPLVDPIRILIR
jgi:hypothetical protein